MYLLIELNKDTGEVTTSSYSYKPTAQRACKDMRDPYVGCVIDTFTTEVTSTEALALVMEELTETQDTAESLDYEVERLSSYEEDYNNECDKTAGLEEDINVLENKIDSLEEQLAVASDYVYTPYLVRDDTLVLSRAGKGLWSIETAEHLLSSVPRERIVCVRHRKDEDPEDVIHIPKKVEVVNVHNQGNTLPEVQECHASEV